MLPPNADPDEVILRTAPLLIVVHNAFEAAAIRSLDFFAPKGRGRKREPIDAESVNSALFSSLVRYYVRLSLNEKGLEAREEDFDGLDPRDVPYDLDNLPNNGLLLKYADCQLRIRKKYYGKLPNPATVAMQEFYQQSLPFGPMPVESLVNGATRLKLMILWNRDSHFRFSGLELVLPIDGGPKFSEWEWRRKIPHPATLIAGRTRSEEDEDLPYNREKKSDTGTDPSSND
jgi:hypothetical protein